MKKYYVVFAMLINSICWSQDVKNISELKDIDPNALVLVNDAVAGNYRDVKKDLDKLSPDIIQSIHILKGETAIKKHGDKGKYGVIEVMLKNVEIGDKKTMDPSGQGRDSIFRKVDVEASFPGGDQAWRNYLARNCNAEVPVDNYAPPGQYTVVVQFIVDKNGDISNVKSLTDHGFGMEEEVVRVISKGGKWQPARMEAEIVKAYRKQPLTFHVEGEFELSTYKLKAGENTTIELKGVAANEEDISVEVAGGTIIAAGNKKYTIKVDKPGYALFTVWVKEKKKKVELGKIALKVE